MLLRLSSQGTVAWDRARPGENHEAILRGLQVAEAGYPAVEDLLSLRTVTSLRS